MKKALILGAGLVTKPIVDYLLSRENVLVTVASRTVSKAEKLVNKHPRGTAIPLNVENDLELDRLVSEHDVTISLVPYAYHVKVAKLCIKYKKDMVTTSYISPEMRALDGEAREAGILILNELGLDPGIDHMSAMKIIHDVEDRGGKIISFKSYCGALPAPEANTNPWGYKFTWSPRGVLLASGNTAKYLWDGSVVDVPSARLFYDFHKVHVDGVGELEAYPNRNSVQYIDLYGLHETQDMYRGTFRNPGWCPLMQKVVGLGLLTLNEIDVTGKTYRQFMAELVGCSPSDDVRARAAEKLGIQGDSPEMEKLAWAGVFEDRPINMSNSTPLDVLFSLLSHKLAIHEGERDMIVLFHNFIAQFEDRKERITSTMIDFGIPNGDTAVARTVSLPAAVGTHLIMDGAITTKGVHMPNLPEFYNPILEELETLHITCKERTFPL
ncbi:MAG TPA: saccharopine dehydrogenase C-terminal domain-containing protein [Thermoanaerobaculia bacterium]|nr:saccharopine dehydrogenase C-terminal domain-containing protein [Thermoanaerobaculia bacterium]HUM29382.1 saccharopine dehydrogenase C-terminal domain-containing protein [Thermoanaerobaculia bacterium]HXK67628.1 saccharopine dehydrogenase C-terminal domain-containing protein [Thermoanaerobaculia bacterium]